MAGGKYRTAPSRSTPIRKLERPEKPRTRRTSSALRALRAGPRRLPENAMEKTERGKGETRRPALSWSLRLHALFRLCGVAERVPRDRTTLRRFSTFGFPTILGVWLRFGLSLPTRSRAHSVTLQRRRVFYAGEVQGVGFRFNAVNCSRGCAVSGFVRNLGDGRVELVAEGAAEQLDEFLARIDGSMSDNIHATEEHVLSATGEFVGFEIRH